MIALDIRVPVTVAKIDFWKTWSRKVPQHWNDLSRKQVTRISGIMADESRSPELRRLLITACLLNLPIWLMNLMTPVQLTQLQFYADFLYKENKLTRQLMPHVRVGLTKLHGPPDALKYVKAKEFIQVEKHFSRYYKTGDLKHLELMMACMYRPKGKLRSNDPHREEFCGDVREDFNANSVEARLKLISKVTLDEKLAFYNWFTGCWTSWQQVFKRVFSKDKKSKADHFGWPETMLNMSGEKFGTIDRAMEHYMFDILLQMEIEMKQHEEMEAKYGKK